MVDGIDDVARRVEVVEQKVDRLSVTMDQRFDQVDERFRQVDERFRQVDERFRQVDERFRQVDKRFDQVDAALQEQRRYTEFSYGRLDAKMDAGFARLERKVDQLIDTQSKTNELVERRLQALESPSRRRR